MKINHLSTDEKIELAEQLWDSIAAEHDTLEMTEPQRRELDNRLDAYSVDKEPGDTWNIVKSRL